MDAAIASPWKRHWLPRRLQYNLTARLRSSWRVDKFLTALPRHAHCVPTALLLERRVTAFVLSMSKRNTDPWRAMLSDGVRWSSHRVATALVAFVPCSQRRSTFLYNAATTPRERHPDVIVVLLTDLRAYMFCFL